MGWHTSLSDLEIENLRLKLRCKVRHHLGGFCPDVEDVVQESLIRLIRADQAGKIEHPDRMGAFLNGVCNNVILEYRRRLMRGESPGPEELPDLPDRTISQAEDLELRDAVDAALSKLLERDSRVLTGIFLEGKTPAEVCAENSIPESHLKVVVFRAKARFRKLYMESVKPGKRTGHSSSEQ